MPSAFIWRFDVVRDAQGLVTSLVATPTGVADVPGAEPGKALPNVDEVNRILNERFRRAAKPIADAVLGATKPLQARIVALEGAKHGQH